MACRFSPRTAGPASSARVQRCSRRHIRARHRRRDGGLSTLVGARAHETAVRIALGASPANTLWRTVAQGLTPVVVGATGGIGAAVVLISSARSLLFQIDRVDVGSLLTGTLVVLGVTLVACIAPALRAARTDPVCVLRGD